MGYILGNNILLNQLSVNQRNSVYWTIVYVRKGRGLYSLGTSLRCLNEGDLLIFPPGSSYGFSPDDLGDEYNINVDARVLRFDSNWLDAVLAAFPETSGLVLKVRELNHPYAVVGPKWIRLSSCIDEMTVCERHVQPVKMFSVLELLSDLRDFVSIGDLGLHNQCPVSSRVESIDRYLSCNLTKKITLEQVADYVGMNRIYFSVFFKKQYGEGFSDYINRLRVEKSMQQLCLSGKSLQQIAADSGFKTVQYFTRAFKKITGVTPGAFRKEKADLVHKDD